MKDIGFGIIGIGRQGLRLAEHIRKDIPHGKLIAVCRRSASGHEYSKEHGIKFYNNHHDLLSDKDVDAVLITTPSNLHGVQALDALKCKKHILIDKPIASNLREGRKIMTMAKKAGLVVAVNLPLRANSVTQAIKRNLPAIGRLRKIQILVTHGPPRNEWQRDIKLSNGGVILDLGSHYLDLVSFLTGCQPETIITAYREEEENENSGITDLSYKDFSVSMVLLRNQKFRKNIITIAGEKGFLLADYTGREVVISNSHEINEIVCPAGNDFETLLNNMVRSINGKDRVIATAEDGLNSLKTALAVYRAAEAKKRIRLQPEK